MLGNSSQCLAENYFHLIQLVGSAQLFGAIENNFAPSSLQVLEDPLCESTPPGDPWLKRCSSGPNLVE